MRSGHVAAMAMQITATKLAKHDVNCGHIVTLEFDRVTQGKREFKGMLEFMANDMDQGHSYRVEFQC